MRSSQLLVFSFILLAANFSFASCPLDTNSILYKIGTRPTSGIIADYDQYKNRIWQGHLDLAKQVWSSYTSGQLTSETMDRVAECVQEPFNRQDLASALNIIFVDASFERLKKINPEMFERLSLRNRGSGAVFFSAFEPIFETSNVTLKELKDKPAGFNDVSRSVLLNISQIPLEDWDVYFLHELGHSIDNIAPYISGFDDEIKIEKISEILKSKAVESQLTTEELSLIDEWISNGLNIGLLAEWRVWSFTAKYLSGEKDLVLIGRSNWLNPILGLSTKTIERTVFEFLDQRYTDPTDGVFSNPIIATRLKAVRARERLSHY